MIAILQQMLRRPLAPSFVVLLLATGMGAAISLYGLADAVLFRPLEVRGQDTLARLFRVADNGTRDNWALPLAKEYGGIESVFAGVAVYADWSSVNVVDGSGEPEQVSAAVVTGNYFDLLGVVPAAGRLLQPDDDIAGAPTSVVLGHAFWLRRFAADEDVIGRTLQLNGNTATVVGVAPPRFGGVELDGSPAVWLPMSSAAIAMTAFTDMRGPDGTRMLESRYMSWLDAVVRLQPGVSLEQARRATAAWHSSRVAAGEELPRAELVPARDAAVDPYGDGSSERVSWLLIGLAGIVLLVVCADAAGILLVRAESRRTETGVRMSLGATPARVLVTQLLEGFIISALAAAVGLLLALSFTRWMLLAFGAELALADFDATQLLNWRIAGATAALMLLVALTTAWLPARRLARVRITGVLGSARSGGTQGRMLTRELLVGMQIALAVALLSIAAMLFTTLRDTLRIDPGFRVDGIAVARVNRTSAMGDVNRFYAEWLQAIRNDPRIQDAALAATMPVRNSGMRFGITLDGYTPAPGEDMQVEVNPVSEGLFATLDIPLLAGRDFAATDTQQSQPVAIVNRAFVERFWNDGRAIGRRIEASGMSMEVVGVVGTVKHRDLREAPRPAVFVPFRQRVTTGFDVAARGADAGQALQVIREQTRALDPEQSLGAPQAMRDRIEALVERERSLSLLAAAAAALATLLAATGIYGVAAYVARARRRELGIRTALGASRARLLVLMLQRGLLIATAGLVAGALLSAVGNRFVADVVAGAERMSVPVLLASMLLAGAVFLLATAVPAWRASQLEPMDVLRDD